MSGRRVAITGLGAVSPLGNSVDAFFSALSAARSGVRRLDAARAQASGVRVAAEVEWNPQEHFPGNEAASLDRVSQFAVVAAGEALAAGGIARDVAGTRAPTGPIGVYWGTGMGGAQTLEDAYQRFYAKGDTRLRPLTVVMAMNNAAGANVSLRYGLRGPFANYSTACSSSAIAIGEAMRSIRDGYAEAILAGGSEALLVSGTLAAWQALRTLAPPDEDDPAASCKPFDRKRSGLVLGEGAAALLLESEEHARARGAPILAFVSGYGNSADAAHMSRPDRDGQARAMHAALADARLAPEAIGYVNAHATATQVGDLIEAQALRLAFGDALARIPVSSTKSLHGHLLGATGALEMLAALLPILRGTLPPTGHLADPDPECALLHVARTARRAENVRAVMTNSFGFGGSNAVLIAEAP